MAETIRCSACGTTVSAGHKFCGGCGALLNPEEGVGTTQRPRYALRLVQEDGSDGELYELSEKGALIGRTEGEIRFPHDSTVSPMHAALKFVEDRLVIRDLKSCNGTFVRIASDEILDDGDVFQCGKQLLRFEKMSWLKEETHEGQTSPKFLSTPLRAWRYKLVQLLATHDHGQVYCSVNPSTSIGREGCDLNFPVDRFISGQHSLVEQRGTLFFLQDLDSRNGTFVKIKGERNLTEGDSLFIGRQLLRIELADS